MSSEAAIWALTAAFLAGFVAGALMGCWILWSLLKVNAEYRNAIRGSGHE